MCHAGLEFILGRNRDSAGTLPDSERYVRLVGPRGRICVTLASAAFMALPKSSHMSSSLS